MNDALHGKYTKNKTALFPFETQRGFVSFEDFA